jgi:hypothetical protein
VSAYEDPHAWLRPFYNKLSQHPAFAQFAPATRFTQLVDAVAADNASKAAEMRQWSAAAQHALLLHLGSTAELGRSISDSVELWRATKDARELRCIARHLPTGVDLQVFERDQFRRSQLCPTAPEARTLAETWRKALIASGWTVFCLHSCSRAARSSVGRDFTPSTSAG